MQNNTWEIKIRRPLRSPLLLCVTIDVTQVKPRAMHVSTEKAIALREKPPFDIIKVIVVPIAECQKEVL